MVREEGNALLLLSQTSHMVELVLNRFPEVVNDWILSTAGASSLSAWSAIIQYVKEGIGIQYTLPEPTSSSASSCPSPSP
jgi:hypothetical protein